MEAVKSIVPIWNNARRTGGEIGSVNSTGAICWIVDYIWPIFDMAYGE